MTWCGHVADEPGNFDFPFGWSGFCGKGAREKPQGGQDSANNQEQAQDMLDQFLSGEDVEPATPHHH